MPKAKVAAANKAYQPPVWHIVHQNGLENIQCAVVKEFTDKHGKTYTDQLVFKGQVQQKIQGQRRQAVKSMRAAATASRPPCVHPPRVPMQPCLQHALQEELVPALSAAALSAPETAVRLGLISSKPSCLAC
jgi:hypothetical protein